MGTEITKIPYNELAFDIDGVVADTFHAFIEMAESQYRVQVQYDSITDYDFLSVLDIEEHIFNEIIDMILDDPLGMGIKPMDGAIEVLSRLMDLGPVTFVTARPDNGAIEAWLNEHFRRTEKTDIRLEATGAHSEKLPVLMRHGINYFVEDRLETCYLVEKGSLVPIIFEQPWNQKPHPFHKVKSWNEISELIRWPDLKP